MNFLGVTLSFGTKDNSKVVSEHNDNNIIDNNDIDNNEALRRALKTEKGRHIFFSKRLPQMTLMTDYFFAYFMDNNNECMQEVLQILFQNKQLGVAKVETQKDNKNLGAHGTVFDTSVILDDGNYVNVEIENTKKGASELRLRFYASTQDTHILNPNEKYTDLPQAYNVIITRKDYFKEKKPIYYIRRCLVESPTKIGNNPKFFEDKHMIMYVNGEYRNYGKNDAFANLMNDFFCTDPDKMKNSVLREHMKKIKMSEKGKGTIVSALSEMLDNNPDFFNHILSDEERAESREEGREEGLEEGLEKGLEQGREENQKAQADSFLRKNINRYKYRKDIIFRAREATLPIQQISDSLDEMKFDIPSYNNDAPKVMWATGKINDLMQTDTYNDSVEKTVQSAYKKAVKELTDIEDGETLLPCEVRALILGNDCESVDDLALQFLAEDVFVEGIAKSDKDKIASYIIRCSPLMEENDANKKMVLNELAELGVKFTDNVATHINDDIDYKASFVGR